MFAWNSSNSYTYTMVFPFYFRLYLNYAGAKFSDYLDLFDEASEQIRNNVIVGADGRHYHPGIIG